MIGPDLPDHSPTLSTDARVCGAHPLPEFDSLCAGGGYGRQTLEHAAVHSLAEIAERRVPPIILVTGSREEYVDLCAYLDASGGDQGFEHIIRLSPTLEEGADKLAFASRDRNGELVGISTQDVLHGIRHQDKTGRLVFVGDFLNVQLAAEAIKGVVPHYPVAVLDLTDGKIDFATATHGLEGMGVACGSRRSALRGGEAFGVEELEQLSVDARRRASESAYRTLEPVRVGNEGYPIPHSVYHCLENVLWPAASKMGLTILLRGGCGIVSLMPVARPISPDIDFTALLPVSEFGRFLDLMREVSSGGFFEIRGDPTKEFTSRSTYVKGQVLVSHGESDQSTHVSLDAVSVRRVLDVFSYEFKYDKVIHQYHRMAVLDSGIRVGVVAPELTLIEKLVAGRGRELDKFDIFDATGILANQPLDLFLLQRIIERQRFDQTIDSEKAEMPMSKVDFVEHLRSLKLLGDERLISLVGAKVIEKLLSSGNRGGDETVNHILHPDRLKRIGLVNKLLTALKAVNTQRELVDDRLVPPASPVTLWGDDQIAQGVSKLREFLYSYVRNVLFNDDVYVQRSRQSFVRSKAAGFWAEAEREVPHH